MPTLRCKILVLGDATVGKSALTQMFHSDNGHYPKNYLMTIGVELYVKAVRIPDTNYSVELYLFDCAGKDIYESLIPKYVEGVSAIALVYDATQTSSYNSLENWLQVVNNEVTKNSKGKPPKIPGVLIANKIDLEERILVKAHKGHEFSQTHSLEFFETSAQSGKDVDAPFNFLANQFYEEYMDKLKQYSKN